MAAVCRLTVGDRRVGQLTGEAAWQAGSAVHRYEEGGAVHHDPVAHCRQQDSPLIVLGPWSCADQRRSRCRGGVLCMLWPLLNCRAI